jgi:molybdopterin-guanine dinucleotide biosynthesis protein A
MVDALVLSGGEIERERFPEIDPGIRCKARIPILGRPMAEWVVQGLRSSQQVGRIVVVGRSSIETPSLRALDAEVVPEAGDISGNLRAGIQALTGSPRVLGLSGDLPLLTREGLEDLFSHAPAADVVFPYVERGDVLQAFPEREWVFSRTPEGSYTGCSVALFRPDALLSNWRWVEELLAARRKSPLGLAGMIGPWMAARYLFGRLRVADVERQLSSLLRLVGRGYPSRFAELAMDVDKQTDIALAEAALSRRFQLA